MAEAIPRITVTDLTMAYGDFVIQRDLNFTINVGEIFILMGAVAAVRVRYCVTWLASRRRLRAIFSTMGRAFGRRLRRLGG